jgi:hypothetical protein
VNPSESEDKPFWTKFLQTEEREQPSQGGDLTKMVMDVLGGQKTFEEAKDEREEDD